MNTNAKNRSALVLFSGGQDSATCLAWALDRFARVETIGFHYGQRHDVEMQARLDVRENLLEAFPHWAVRLGEDQIVDLSGYGALAESSLTSERAIEMEADGLPNTFVPGRNLVFLSVASAYAYRRGHEVMVGGMCETDFSGYPDCRRETLDAMQGALSLGLATEMVIETPLMALTKSETWALADTLGGQALVDLIRTQSHTCYLGEREHLHDWGYGCGTCPACELRARGWSDWQAVQGST